MMWLYTFLVLIAQVVVRVLGLFNPKLKAFIQGRDQLKNELKSVSKNERWIWFHAASLGEFEQGLPIMQAIKNKYPDYRLVVTFFSPSGYQIRKNHPLPDAVHYLPWDTPWDVRRFLNTYQPEMAFLVKYEFWPNLLDSLYARQIPTFLVSGLFRPSQAFFKWYGGFFRKRLRTFTQFFVQTPASEQLLRNIGIQNVRCSGDTRYDRVQATVDRFEPFEGFEAFTQGNRVLVAGSCWPPEEALMFRFIEEHKPNLKWIIAPHRLDAASLNTLEAAMPKPCVRFSKRGQANLHEAKSILVDTMGYLSRLYAYGNMAIVGGGYGTAGLHNILEPAAFGLPVIIGPNHQKFPEAAALIEAGGCFEAPDYEAFAASLNRWVSNEALCQQDGMNSRNFIINHQGATAKVMTYLEFFLTQITH
ncbi:MAG: 3-deoxy-D-manno-octulosonic acid transferase [Flavobacterium sp. BFFFF2]|nr:MAG: 3-deoxy-D-manno-octulosonic acid transferase [Flavobacterium sp. BFFFF2]